MSSIVQQTRTAACLLLIVVCLSLLGCRHRNRSFILASDMKPGWVAVILADPTCVDPGGSALETRIRVPATGYVCTSIPRVHGQVIEHYYLEAPDGRLQELRLDKEIFRPATTEIKSVSCDVFAETFWYGPADKMQGDPSVVVRNNRKQCQ